MKTKILHEINIKWCQNYTKDPFDSTRSLVVSCNEKDARMFIKQVLQAGFKHLKIKTKVC